MDRYYTDYDDFRGKYYWSSNPGAEGHRGSGVEAGIMVGNEGENIANARATKTNTWNEVTERFEHAPSAANEDYPTYLNRNNGEIQEGGDAPRTEKFRIRAIYVPRYRQNEIDMSER